MKPHLHANSSASRFGGHRDDYIEIHEFIDSSKSHFADVRHRAMLHNTWGIYLCERIFGRLIINSAGREVSVRDIAEHHVLEDLGRIPPISDYLNNITLQKWMGGPKTRTHKVMLNMVD